MIDMIVDGKERSTLNYFNNSVIVGAYGVLEHRSARCRARHHEREIYI
jgi:hypothetical protein